MVAKKISSKAVKATPAFDISKLKPGGRVMYAQPIFDVIARGNAVEMRQLATAARSYIKEVQAAIDKLEAKVK
ncbi:MAG: hypothetical protein QOH63_3606 [Acidobacteriota bacterium]|jgi:hypothetical protein|nr:hypothetical protein [Acidobacteriota bacterium]